MTNRTAFLDMLAVSELGVDLLANSDNGYNVLVGSTAEAPHLFSSYADHPRVLVTLPRLGIKSTAAGRYQVLARYFDAYKAQLGLPDFGHDSQDAIAVQMIKESRAIDAVDFGQFELAVAACAHIWASLPGAPYGQHTNSIAALRDAYAQAGGTFA